jgi:hypothetical protein
MKRGQFLKVMQQRVASGAVTPSAARNMGPPGTVRAARSFLAKKVSLKDVGSSGRRYSALLDELTLKLMRALPEKAQRWGPARKFLNIFLRDATYNVYLRNAFRLDRVESQLEVPLDSHVAEELTRRVKSLARNNKPLPKWRKVISLDRTTSQSYQDAARQIAKMEKIDPVHFDVIAWRKRSGYL